MGKDTNITIKADPNSESTSIISIDDTLYYGYRFRQAGVTSSIAVFARKQQTFLLIKRGRGVEIGKWAFPGGFLDVGKETIEDCAARELKEETGIDIDRIGGDLKYIDHRSDPNRDSRNHVIDFGFLLVIDEQIPYFAGDDAAQALWTHCSRVKDMDLAFDHDQMFESTLKYLKKKRILNFFHFWR